MGLPSADDFRRLETALTSMRDDICGRLDQLIELLSSDAPSDPPQPAVTAQ